MLELILCDIGNTTYHFLIKGKHKKYFLDEKVPTFNDDIYFVSVNEKASKKINQKKSSRKKYK